ncbi:Adrenodoxin mitochondrial [Fusarium duplospermum]|uniref:Adrenodoxin mitochondrial n=1 Tax=Fusarium duplospermum TaxID=1325734 RepID=A0A428QW33_9HYPO|nr:Adrenodoxin mitochondrial [Fusarium duplospermum]
MSAPRSFATSLAKLSATACRRTQPFLSRGSILSQTSSRSRSAIIPRAARSSPVFQRAFTTSAQRRHGHVEPPKPGEELWVTFIEKDGQEHKIAVSEGDNLLDIAQANDLEMEGACGGSCACSTCHVIVLEDEYFDKMPEPEDDENDMLDLAFGLTETSRLGCQVLMTKELDGLRVKLPSMTRNLQASDFQ